VLLPLALITYLGLRLAHYEQQNVNRQLNVLLTGQLNSINTDLAQFLENRRRQISDILAAAEPNADKLRSIADKSPFIAQVFLLNPQGFLIYPNPKDNLTADELAFLRRAQDILSYNTLVNQSPPDSPAQANPSRQQQTSHFDSAQNQAARQQISPATIDNSQLTRGWFTWFWGYGLHIILWQRQPNGSIIGADLDSSRLLADVINILPEESYSTENYLKGRIVLCDAADKNIYQWGRFEPPDGTAPISQIQLKFPLSSWRLKYYLPPEFILSFQGATPFFAVTVGIVTAALALVALAVYFFRENTRQIRLAQQRVTFVNQVSHELKTPLTNIRMFAELMQDTIADDQAKAVSYLGVIIDESCRLTRLIANVLTFGKSQKDKLNLRFSPAVVDNVINLVLANFKASFEKRHITADFAAAAPDLVEADPDAIAQILGNLLSNVEKYAALGRYVKITSRRLGSVTTITVTDKGPGIPSNMREKIFRPFNRISNKLTDGVSGTGIGLNIARQLARLHGGDIVLLPADSGAVFEITLKTQTPQTGEQK